MFPIDPKHVADRVVAALGVAYANTDHCVPFPFLAEAGDAAYGAVMDALTKAPSLEVVPVPKSADQAVGMLLLAEAWLREHAPDRLRVRSDAIPEGFRVERHSPCGHLTAEANQQRRYLVTRIEVPFEGRLDRKRVWYAPTLDEALADACKSLDISR